MIRKFRVFYPTFGIFNIAKVNCIIQLLDTFSIKKAALPSLCWIVLTNFWISSTKIKQINPASTGFFIQPLDIYRQIQISCFFCWNTLSIFWISTSRIKQITQASTDPLSAICSTNKIDPNILLRHPKISGLVGLVDLDV